MQKVSTTTFIIFSHDLQPVLYWLHKDVPAEEAPGYWRCLHELVYSLGHFTHKGFPYMVGGTEFLLRIFCFRPYFVSCQGKGYCAEKFGMAFDYYKNYFKEMGYPLAPSQSSMDEPNRSAFDDGYERLCEQFDRWAARMAGAHSEHAAWVRFVQALLGHLGELERAGEFLEVGESVQKPLYALLACFLASGFRLDLPEGEGMALHDLWATCEPSWRSVQFDE